MGLGCNFSGFPVLEDGGGDGDGDVRLIALYCVHGAFAFACMCMSMWDCGEVGRDKGYGMGNGGVGRGICVGRVDFAM